MIDALRDDEADESDYTQGGQHSRQTSYASSHLVSEANEVAAANGWKGSVAPLQLRHRERGSEPPLVRPETNVSLIYLYLVQADEAALLHLTHRYWRPHRPALARPRREQGPDRLLSAFARPHAHHPSLYFYSTPSRRSWPIRRRPLSPSQSCALADHHRTNQQHSRWRLQSQATEAHSSGRVRAARRREYWRECRTGHRGGRCKSERGKLYEQYAEWGAGEWQGSGG